VVGASPTAEALVALAAALDIDVERDGDDAGRPATAVVVATHGHDEEETIRAALDAGVGYVGLVASRRRGTAVLDALGLDDAERARVHTPAGLPLGAATPPEVALSILAEVVRAIRVDGLRAPAGGVPDVHDHGDVAGGPVPDVHDHGRVDVDPVCGMAVVAGDGVPRLERDGVTYWFCGTGCRDAFAGSTT
jgi:xanthine dehydrogenase accessory factor